MNKIDGVSRELIRRVVDGCHLLGIPKNSPQVKELRALLAAPVVERQEPVMLWSDYERIADIKSVDEALRAFSEDATGDNGVCVVRAIVESTAPPQLAELQAEIERQRKGFGEAQTIEHKKWADHCAALQATIDQQAARIGELEARSSMTNEQLIEIARNAALNSVHRYNYMPCLPEEAYLWEPHYWVIEAMRACIDATAALNGVKS